MFGSAKLGRKNVTQRRKEGRGKESEREGERKGDGKKLANKILSLGIKTEANENV